jgi:CheY-like chemotaxis protein
MHSEPRGLGVDVFRVLAVDDEESVLTEIDRQLRPFEIEVLPASRAREAQRILDDTYIDAAIVDIRLHGQDAGIEVLNVMTERAPAAVAVIATRYTDRFGPFVGMSEPRLAKIVHKGARDTPRDWAAAALKGAYDAWRSSRIDIDNLELAVDLLRDRAKRIPGLREVDREVGVEVDRLLRRLFGSVSTGDFGDGTQIAVELLPIEREGLSAAITVRADVKLGRDSADRPIPASPVILKIGPANDIRIETERYHRFVKYGVPLLHRVELLGTAIDQSLGAICYGVAALDAASTPETLDEALASPDWAQRASVAIYQLFETPSKSWYSVTGEPIATINYVYDTWDTDLDSSRSALEETLQGIRKRLRKDDALVADAPTEDDDGALAVGQAKLRLPPISIWGTGLFVTALPTRLVHGDMHGGNVMIEATRDGHVRPRLIDYRSVGPGPRVTDFAVLDASLRLADVQGVIRSFDVDDEQHLDEDAFRRALLICAAREREERRLLYAWAGQTLKRPPSAQWSTIGLQLAGLARINFHDIELNEYLAIAMPVAYRHIGLSIGLLGRVRFAAWLSALYDAAPAQSDRLPPVTP